MQEYCWIAMKRQALLTLLEQYAPIDKQEQEYKSTIINFIRGNTDCFERSLKIGHITASAWLVNKHNSHALLMHHAKLDKWVQLGGHCDGQADVLLVALKEAQEESGIQTIVPASQSIFDIDVHLIPANSKEAEHYHYDIRFLLRVENDASFVKNHESKQLAWFSKDNNELPTKERSVVRMFEKWQYV